MKTKKELSALHGKSNGSWRNLSKGEVEKAQRRSLEAPRFKVAGYVRISPTNEDRDEGSLVSNPQRIRGFVTDKNRYEAWGEIAEMYVDKDYSGKDTNRPAFQRLLKDIQRGKINAVVVTELSRLSRSMKDFCDLYEFFKDHRVAFFSLRENFDTSSPAGELMLMNCVAFAQFERHTIVDRIKRGARARAERGLANGSAALGFKLVDHKPNHREIEESERPLVELIFRKMLELKRLASVADFLNSEGYRTKEYISKTGHKTGGKLWTISAVHWVLTNRAYIGQREFNRRFRGADQSELKNEDRYFFVDAQWPALIDVGLFEDVQSLLELNDKKSHKAIHQYRLSGLVRCAECGSLMNGKSGNGNGGRFYYYGHQRKLTGSSDTRSIRCKVESVPAVQLEEVVVSRLKHLANDRVLVEELARNLGKESSKRKDHNKSLSLSLNQEATGLRQKVNNLIESIADESDRSLRDVFKARITELQARLESVESQIAKLTEDERAGNLVDASSVFALLKAFRKGFDKAAVADQIEILREIVAGVEVMTNGIQVKIFGLTSLNSSTKGPAVCRSSVRVE